VSGCFCACLGPLFPSPALSAREPGTLGTAHVGVVKSERELCVDASCAFSVARDWILALWPFSPSHLQRRRHCVLEYGESFHLSCACLQVQVQASCPSLHLCSPLHLAVCIDTPSSVLLEAHAGSSLQRRHIRDVSAPPFSKSPGHLGADHNKG
jgi:hypothetical protein